MKLSDPNVEIRGRQTSRPHLCIHGEKGVRFKQALRGYGSGPTKTVNTSSTTYNMITGVQYCRPTWKVVLIEHRQSTVIPGLRRMGIEVQVVRPAQGEFAEIVLTKTTVWDHRPGIPVPIPFFNQRSQAAIRCAEERAARADRTLGLPRGVSQVFQIVQ